ncbi:MAG: hypothetical protein JOZ29_21350 [Deltaproteobacteria bacterium]|nr:hypothetical protein [Deltaproteobacteria bacterium]
MSKQQGNVQALMLKLFAITPMTKGICRLIFLCSAAMLWSACSSVWSTLGFPNQSQVAQETEQVERLKSAEYEDYVSGMNFENSDQKLGNFYIHKGAQVHRLIDQMERGNQVNNDEINQALDTSGAEQYDDRPPVPLDDEIGNGY